MRSSLSIATFAGQLLIILFGILGTVGSSAAESEQRTKKDRMRITIGAKTFTATIAENATASAFKALLPMSLQMRDLHENEKFSHLVSPLPSDDANPGTIQAGDLMLWSSNSVVLFYKSFATTYSYTKLGRINNSEGLSSAVGEGNVTIKFELE